MERGLKFKELKKYISKLDRLSICRKETMQYENYRYLRMVPDKYDEFYVYGIGMIDSEFPVEGEPNVFEVEGNENGNGNGEFMGRCIEIMLSETPRDQMDDL